MWFFTYALTAKIRLELIKEKEARTEDKEKFELELYKKSEELGRIEIEFAEYRKIMEETA